MKVTQSCPTLCDPMDCSLPGSSIYGIFQARILEWVAIPFSKGSPDPGVEPRSPALQVDSLPSEPPGKPHTCWINGFIFMNPFLMVYAAVPQTAASSNLDKGNLCESQWTLGVGDGQGGLACCDSWGCRVGHDWATDLIWSDSIITSWLKSIPRLKEQMASWTLITRN